MDSVYIPEAAKTAFELMLLGPPNLRDSRGQTPPGMGAGKPLALLSFLVVRGETRRDEALALLWGDVDEDRARNAFRQALHRLRLALGDDLVGGDRQTLSVAIGDRLRCDVREFEKAAEGDRPDQALALYRGDFLEGFDVDVPAFDQWAEGERARLRARCQSTAELAVRRALGEGRLDDAEGAIRRLVSVAPLDASAAEVAATAFVSMGRRAEAVELLQQFSRRSSLELGVAPPERLQKMLLRMEPAARGISARDVSGEAPFVGRRTELTRLLTAWQTLAESSGATVIVEGPTGSGKSRLVREFVEHVRALGNVHALYGVETHGAHSAPYAAIASALRPLIRAQGVAATSPHLLAEAARLLPELRDAFQLPPVEPGQEEAGRLRIAEGVAALLEAAAAERHICLIMEDLHRALDTTLELLGYLAGRLRQAPVLLLLTIDPEAAPPNVASRLRAIDARRVAVKPVGSPESPLSSKVSGTLAKQFPHWRYLASAAVITSVVAIAVSALAPARPPAFVTTDTLLVSMALESRHGLVHLVTDDRRNGLRVSEARERLPSRPAWADSLVLPWVNALPSPNGRFVAVERITSQGSNVYVISANRRDTVPLIAGAAEALGMGWSPDGESFLATRRDSAAADSRASLYVFSALRKHPPLPIDTTPGHSVTEAAWSPDGSRIGWVARVAGAEEVFVSWADGDNRRNLSNHEAQDYHFAWSADGSLVAFTSRRDGNAEIYAFDLLSERLWRLTNHPAQDDRAAFAGDGRVVAFESTRGGAPDVYVMPVLGGGIRRVGAKDSTARYEIIGWRRQRPRFIDRLEISGAQSANVGDSVVLRARAFDQFGSPFVLDHARWSLVDGTLLRELPNASGDSVGERRFVAWRNGLARVAVSIGAWRSDTTYVHIGDGRIGLIEERFDGVGLPSGWRFLGEPAPAVGRLPRGGSGLRINADRQWESGVLSVGSVPLLVGLSLEANLHALFDAHGPRTTATLALVAPDPPGAIDTRAPRPFRLISITWDADARRLVYAAERDVFAEAVPDGSGEGMRRLGMRVNDDATVSFFVDGVERWRSTLRVSRPGGSARAQIWLGGQDTGARVAFANLIAYLESPRR